MKKFLLILMMTLFFVPVFAQWSVGPRIGLNFATLTGDTGYSDDEKSGWITSLNIGAVGNYEFSDMISLNAELLLVTVGDKTKYSETGEKSSLAEYNTTITERYHYLQVPVLIRLIFGSNLIYFANIGPYYGHKIGGHHKADVNGHVTEGRIRFNEDKLNENDWLFDSDYERRSDIGMYIGGGAGKKIGPGVLEADLRFGFGLIDHNKFESREQKQNAKDNGYKAVRTMNVSLTFAYMIEFQK